MIFYNLFLYLLFPIAILRLFSKKEFNVAQIKRIKERLGLKKHLNCEEPIWIHAGAKIVKLLFINLFFLF